MRGRRSLRTAVSTSGALVAVACLGSTRGGSDSETHFACVADDGCRGLGSHVKCIAGHCQPVSPAPLSGALGKTTSTPDGGKPAPPAPGGGNPTSPTSTEDGGKPAPPAPNGGSAAPGPWNTPLESAVTIKGTISIPAEMTVSLADLRVALVWKAFNVYGVDDPECFPYESGNVPLSSVPVAEVRVDEKGSFTFDVTNAPPHDAFSHPSLRADGAYVAEGVILAYEDGDHDGRLDLSTPLQPSPDVVLGTSAKTDLDQQFLGTTILEERYYRITYSDRDVLANEPPLVSGLQILSLGASPLVEVLPPESEIRIVLSDSPGVHALICQKLCWAVSGAPGCPTQVKDLPPGGIGMCTPWYPGQLSAYFWNDSTCDGCNCIPHACGYAIPGTEPAPEGWPCTQISTDGGR